LPLARESLAPKSQARHYTEENQTRPWVGEAKNRGFVASPPAARPVASPAPGGVHRGTMHRQDGRGGCELEAGGAVLVELEDGDGATRGAGDRQGQREEMGPASNELRASLPGELRPSRLRGRPACSAWTTTMADWRAPRGPSDNEAPAWGDRRRWGRWEARTSGGGGRQSRYGSWRRRGASRIRGHRARGWVVWCEWIREEDCGGE
jgi:hypothetical protein